MFKLNLKIKNIFKFKKIEFFIKHKCINYTKNKYLLQNQSTMRLP